MKIAGGAKISPSDEGDPVDLDVFLSGWAVMVVVFVAVPISGPAAIV